MKPYLVVSGDFVTMGGQDRANHALASYLSRHRSEVHLVAHRVARDLLDAPAVHFHRAPKPLRSYELGEPLVACLGRAWARRIARRAGTVVVNGGNCEWGDVNWVHYVHGAYEPESGGGPIRSIRARAAHLRHRRCEARAVGRARLVVANSQRTRGHLADHVGIDPAKVRVVYCGIDPARFQPASPDRRLELRRRLGWAAETPVVLFVGALGDRRKGFDTLFRGWEILCSDPAWRANLVVVGQGPELPTWRAAAARIRLAGRIHFTGFRTDVDDMMRAADALVSPTRYEAYGLGVHEALCCGLPAFVSAGAGIAERYPRELQELLIDPEDAEDLARRMRSWNYNAGQVSSALARFSAELRAYTWDHMAADFVAMVDGE